MAVMEDRFYMKIALEQAQAAMERDEVPIGAVIVDPEGEILAVDGNRMIELCDPTAHAEILVIRHSALQKSSQRLSGHSLYVTLEPCPMCAAAISFARIDRLYYGARDMKGGGVEHGPKIFSHTTCHHKPRDYGLLNEPASSALLKDFFRCRR